VKQVLAEAGVPLGAPLHVLHAYKLRNAKLHQEFNRKLSGGVGGSGRGGSAAASPVASPGGTNGAASLPPPQGYTHRLLAMRLPPRSVEHVLVHGLRPKPPLAQAREWQVDPRTVPEAGCVDMDSLASIIGASLPPPPPFALFSGGAAWDELLASAIEEAITARNGLAAGLASSVAGERANGHAKGGAAGGAPTNRLIVLCRVLVPLSPSEAIAERMAASGSPVRHSKAGTASAAAATAAALAQARLAAAYPPPGTASTTDPEMILPLYLLHYGTMTAPPPEPQMPPAPLSLSSGSEKNVAQVEKAVPAEPRAVRNDSGGASKGGRIRAAAAAAAAAAAIAGGAGGAASRAAAPSASAPAETEFGKLPAALRATREHQVYLTCRAATAERMREVAGVFAATIEGMTQQLTPARSNALVEEERREAELQMLLNDAKAELSKLKKTNRDLASELNTTY
jgi:hypothetical protein